MKVTPIPIRSDNYMYILSEPSPAADARPKALLVDPAVPDALERVKKTQEVDVVGILTTHHHGDHAGGNAIIAKAMPGIPIYGGQPADGSNPQVEAVTNVVKDGDVIKLGDSISIRCLATPCHTQDSICYHATTSGQQQQGAVFTGDTLFQGGCGRFFEGTPAEMHSSLSYLASSLPDDTIVYNGHEYTASNLKFAKTVEPSSEGVKRLAELCEKNKITAGKSTIGDEKAWNIFMRLDSDPIRKATGKTDPVDVMSRLREMKNAM